VITLDDLSLVKDGCILANVGHFNNEIELPKLKSSEIASDITRYDLGNKNIYVLAEGNLVNLTTGMGYPIQIIDASFAAAVHSWIHFHSNQQIGLIEYPEILDKTYFSDEIEKYKDLT
jgi:adenosylhomocysteinase